MPSTALRRLSVATLVTALAVGVTAGCSREGDSTTAKAKSTASGGKVRIGLVQVNQQAIFFNQMNDGAKAAAKKTGADLTVFNANDDAVQQNQAVQDFVQQGYDAVIVEAIDVNGIKPALRAAAKAGVKVIAVDGIIDDPSVDVQVGVDNAAAGKQIGAFVNEYDSTNKISANIGVVGALNSYIQNLRKDNFVSTVKAKGATVLQTVDGKNTQEGAATAAENLLTAQKGMNTVYATGEPALLGTVAAVKSAGAQNRVKVFGWDLTKQAIDGIDAGFVAGVVQQDPKTEGGKAVEAAVALVKGETVAKEIDVPVTIVTKKNVDPYRSIFK
ncbi:substrate-binding domain-containing protein [Streptomyces sp. NPDC091377]|uniref:substrate-binding domain-containing protein n=1 Tax=Streptomyces sp. NPDC091377 TaxID=3365995 RepID=UPI003805728A